MSYLVIILFVKGYYFVCVRCNIIYEVNVVGCGKEFWKCMRIVNVVIDFEMFLL